MAEVRKLIECGEYLDERADEKMAVVVEGLLRDLLTGFRRRPVRRAAG